MTTRIAVITDAHANLPALETALSAITAARCDAIYHTGDAIGVGPFPAEVLDRLLHTPAMHLLMGNHDEWFAFGIPDPRPAWMPEGAAAHIRWVHQQLDPSMRPVVAAWPYAIEVSREGVTLAFTHYPRDPDGGGFAPILTDPGSDALDRLFITPEADVIFYGHYHPASDVQGRARYVNPGSLGCDREALARFAILDIAADGMRDLRVFAVPYDPSDYFRQLREREVAEREFIEREIFGRDSES
jgi:predicted phosphodiesterase